MFRLFIPREPREQTPTERRVAATPDSVRWFADKGAHVVVEAGAGAEAGHPDDAYEQAGATVAQDREDAWASAELVVVVGPPQPEDAARMREGAVLVGLLAPHRHLELVRVLAERKVTALAMEHLPRITRTQRMDALSSQATVAGYRGALTAAYLSDKHLPLSMTAAGTLRPATVIVLGVGVAGLQAIATSRRLGAVVRANDVREAAKAEAESLGAEFIDLDDASDGQDGGQDAGGYAREATEDALTRQRQILTSHLGSADALITTAVVPGRPAPELVTTEMVEAMRPGAVVVDLAAAEGGNCTLTDPGGEVLHEGVRIVPGANLAAELPREASMLYARNVFELCALLLGDDGELRTDRDEEVSSPMLIVNDGAVTHEPTAELLHREGEAP